MDNMSAVLLLLTILALIFGVWASIIVAVRMRKLAKFGAQHGSATTDEEQRVAVSAYSFGRPLVVAIVCWAFIAARCVQWLMS